MASRDCALQLSARSRPEVSRLLLRDLLGAYRRDAALRTQFPPGRRATSLLRLERITTLVILNDGGRRRGRARLRASYDRR